MISFLKGKVLNKGKSFIILLVDNIGYKIFISPNLYAEAGIGQNLELYTHHHVREDALSLYGFKTMSELEIYELLLSVSGIGPKSALGVLAVASLEDLEDSISRGDPSLLTKVSGIGKKTAERVVLELRGKMDLSLTGGLKARESSGSASGDEIDALMALGYSMGQAREALRLVDTKIKDSGDRIREALKKLGR